MIPLEQRIRNLHHVCDHVKATTNGQTIKEKRKLIAQEALRYTQQRAMSASERGKELTPDECMHDYFIGRIAAFDVLLAGQAQLIDALLRFTMEGIVDMPRSEVNDPDDFDEDEDDGQ